VQLAAILDSAEIQRFIADLEGARWTGRPGYPIRALLGVALAKSLYAIPTWSRTVALVHEHDGLQRALGDVPSVYAAYRFAVKLHRHGHLLDQCIQRVLTRLRADRPEMGRHIAIDASDLPAYANGQRYVSKGGRERASSEYSDPDASWGHRSAVSTRKGGGFYGYRIHAAVCTLTGLPVAWNVETAKVNESIPVPSLLDALSVAPQTCAMDKGYDMERVYEDCAQRGIQPVIPLRQTPAVKRGDHLHGQPDGSRLRPFIERASERWRQLYKARGAVEREFGRLKHEWAMLPLRVRGLARVRLHVDLTILTKLAAVQT
jgi:transposase